MNDSLFSTKDIVKYLIVAGLIYSILKMIPAEQMNNKDIILVLAIISIGFVSVDCIFFKSSDKSKQEKKEDFAQEDDPFALDLNFDIEKLLERKAEMQKAKAQPIKQVEKQAIKQDEKQPIKQVEKQAEKQAIKLDTQVAKVELKEAKAELKDAKVDLKVAQTELKGAATPVTQAMAKVQVAKATNVVAKTQQEVSKAAIKVDKKVAVAVAKGVPVSPRSETPKSETPKSETPKSETPKSETPKSETPKFQMIDRPVRSESQVPKSTEPTAKVGCAMEVDKVKKELQQEINKLKVQLNSQVTTGSNGKIAAKYFDSLLSELNDKGVLDARDIENIQLKMKSKLLTVEEVISSLEMLKKEGKSRVRSGDGKVKDDKVYNELPSDFYSPLGDKISNEWDNEYTILNTSKWQVPMPRPPVCVNTAPCKVCPSDSSNYPVNLKQWDDSRYVSQSKINKKWSDDQARA